ncbi:Arylsulfatase I [Eumeta japonica]|uniref:Arylsulfatase I n=1 Tax=Eumeta variegata TaxID=151549 RepID=A0A4C1SZV0_EUMVA|nr:Arylsulfatase I [Eumeta japonica]
MMKALAVLCAMANWSVCAFADQRTRPHIVYILADDMATPQKEHPLRRLSFSFGMVAVNPAFVNSNHVVHSITCRELTNRSSRPRPGSKPVPSDSKSLLIIGSQPLSRIPCDALRKLHKDRSSFQGWNDVGFHGSDQIPTPNIDALAYSGRPLQRYYAPPVCTPSRAALLTGKYPIRNGVKMPLKIHFLHSYRDFFPENSGVVSDEQGERFQRGLKIFEHRRKGMQHGVIYGAEPRGLPLTETLLPQHLQRLGYRTHLVGKWHLGSYKREYLPLNRGFESHLGFWTGRIDYYDHTSMEHGSWGFDIRRGWSVAHDLFGEYITDVLTAEAVRLIQTHNASQPLFLLLAHSAVHSGNPYTPLRAPDDLVDNFKYINNYQRRKYAAMLTKFDESVGHVVEALHRHGMLQQSVVVMSSDNGGAAAGFNLNAASNYPLRGVKNTLWEGGVRVAALIWSPLLRVRGPATRLLHAVDWLPTLYTAAGGNVSDLGVIDGVSQWDALSRDGPSPRTQILHNIDDIYGNAALTDWPWKILKGTTYNGNWDGWYGPGGRGGRYDLRALLDSRAGRALAALRLMPNQTQILSTRAASTIQCGVCAANGVACRPLQAPCLFNIELDPCELNNLAETQPAVLQRLLSLLQQYNASAAPPNNQPLDPKGDPARWDHVYTNFGDYE